MEFISMKLLYIKSFRLIGSVKSGRCLANTDEYDSVMERYRAVQDGWPPPTPLHML